MVVQEIKITMLNTEYKKEVYYYPSQKKTFIGKLPEGVEGEFGPGVKSLVLTLKHEANTSQPEIVDLFQSVGIHISPATISRILTKDNEIEIFHQDKRDIFEAGLKSTIYQQIDDTSARVNGQNQFVQIICNPHYAAYFTFPSERRLSILDILRGEGERIYCFNEEAFSILSNFNLSQNLMARLLTEAEDKILSDEEIRALLDRIFPHPGQSQNNRTRIIEVAAIAAYHQQIGLPVIPILLSDNAPQYKLLTLYHALCWIHEGRHYKKLDPVMPLFKKELEQFRKRFWDYYQKLLQFKEAPTKEESESLSAEFDELFSTQCNYPALADRIEKTKAKKRELLSVLIWPKLPLHTNDAELCARAQVRLREVSLQTKTEEGTKAKDTFLIIVQKAKKLGLSAYEYIYDRVSKSFKMPSLAELITAKAAHDNIDNMV